MVNGSSLFCGTNHSIYLSTNIGTSWSATNLGLPNTSVIGLAGTGTDLFAGLYGDGLYISNDNGSSWNSINMGFNPSITSFALSDTNIFAGLYGGVYLSTNRGKTWKQSNSGFMSDPTLLALGVIGTNILAGTFQGGIFLSTNNGATWISASSDLSTTSVYAFAVSGTTVFA